MDVCNNYLVIDLDVVKENLENIRSYTKKPVMAVVKANAYGHGAVMLAKHMEPLCAFFGVATASEALQLRENGIEKPILMLGHTPVAAFPSLLPAGVRPAIFTYEDALALSEAAGKLGIVAPFHFAVDTGLSRIGFQVTCADADLCQKITRLPNIKAEGLFSHFSNADDEDQTRTNGQLALFEQFNQMLKHRGIEIPILHTENSAALTNFEHHYDMVRAGIMLYGMYPSDQVRKEHIPIKPPLSWYSRVTLVKHLEPGRVISYGAEFTVQRPSLVATVSVGYADGFRRQLKDKAWVLIRGKKARLLGRVCMDQIVVDVTDIPGVTAGDRVTLIGTDGTQTITADEMAAQIGTISYEVFCSIGYRVPRFYKLNGQIIHKEDYVMP